MMKKLLVLALFLMTLTVFQYCSSSKKSTTKTTAKVPAKLNYTKNVQALVVANCSPCHFPPKGNKLPLATYASVKDNIDDILSRIQKNPTDRGFMPFKHAKLADSTINVFVKWKADGLMEN